MKELAVVVSNDNQGVTAFETIDAIKAAGFKNVFIQWYNKDFPISQEEQLRYIKASGLNVVFVHLGYQGINHIWEDNEAGDALLKRYLSDLECCKENGIEMVIMHLTSKSQAPLYNELGLKRLKKIADYANHLGIKVAFENTKIKGYLDYVITHIDNDNVGICFDSGHCHLYFDDDFDFGIFKDRIFAVHLHDNDRTDDQHLLPYDGNIDWDWLTEKLKEANYKNPVTLEICYRERYSSVDLKAFFVEGRKRAEKISGLLEQ